MHILTKILVVLVSLLVVALVPLAAVSATNQLTFKEKAATTEAALKSQAAESQAAKDGYNASIVAMTERAKSLETQLALLRQQAAQERQGRAEFEKQAEALRLQVADLQGQTAALAQSSKSQAAVIENFRQELGEARSLYLAAEKQRIELQDALGRAQIELAQETDAKRTLQEQLQKITEEKEQLSGDLARYRAVHGSMMSVNAGATTDAILPVPADRSLSATIVGVRRNPDATMAEISVGSRDGVKPGWVMIIADGQNFIGNLRITDVDVGRAVGIVELEDRETRGEVRAGQRAIARKGE